jgi:hypothetical protein
LGYVVILHANADRARAPRWAQVVAAVGAVGTVTMVSVSLPSASLLEVGLVVAVALALAFFVLARGSFALALKVVAAFWLVVMTYVAVNWIGAPGLHSYGSAAGDGGRSLGLAAGLELLFVCVCGALAWRRRSTLPAGPRRLGGTEP